MKILCLTIPHFPLICEVLRQPSLNGRSTIVIYASGSQMLVFDYSPEMEGLQRDMLLQQALTYYGDVRLLTSDMPYYHSVFDELLDRLEGISPLVEGAELGCVYIGVDGLQLVYPDDMAIVDAVLDSMPETFAPQIGLAGNKFLAYLLACNCHPGDHQILTGDLTTFLNDLPCGILPISIKSRQKLHDFGLYTLGQLSALSPGPLLSQFGIEGKRIYTLARGQDDTPIYPRIMTQTIEESLMLPSVTVVLEVIMVALESLLARVFAKIDRSGLGICSLDIWTRTWNMVYWEQNIRFKEPAMEAKSMIARMRRVLDDNHQSGPVEHVGLRVTRLGYPYGRQKSLLTEVRTQENLMEDIRQLEMRLGNKQIYRVQEMEPWSRIPERRYLLAPANR